MREDRRRRASILKGVPRAGNPQFWARLARRGLSMPGVGFAYVLDQRLRDRFALCAWRRHALGEPLHFVRQTVPTAGAQRFAKPKPTPNDIPAGIQESGLSRIDLDIAGA
jgi:hypothetical protein